MDSQWEHGAQWLHEMIAAAIADQDDHRYCGDYPLMAAFLRFADMDGVADDLYLGGESSGASIFNLADGWWAEAIGELYQQAGAIDDAPYLGGNLVALVLEWNDSNFIKTYPATQWQLDELGDLYRHPEGD